jgi:hypothetical protein
MMRGAMSALAHSSGPEMRFTDVKFAIPPHRFAGGGERKGAARSTTPARSGRG